MNGMEYWSNGVLEYWVGCKEICFFNGRHRVKNKNRITSAYYTPIIILIILIFPPWRLHRPFLPVPSFPPVLLRSPRACPECNEGSPDRGVKWGPYSLRLASAGHKQFVKTKRALAHKLFIRKVYSRVACYALVGPSTLGSCKRAISPSQPSSW